MNKILFATIMLVCSCLSMASGAETVNIYTEPDLKAKVVTTVKSGEHLIPIFYSDKKEWVKVALPKTGAVGWAKIAELKGPIIIAKVNDREFHYQIVGESHEQPVTYRMVQYSSKEALPPKERKKLLADMEKYSSQMRSSITKMQKEMDLFFKDMHKLFTKMPSMGKN